MAEDSADPEVPEIFIVIRNEREISISSDPIEPRASPWSMLFCLLCSLWNGIKDGFRLLVKVVLTGVRYIRYLCEMIGKAIISTSKAFWNGFCYLLRQIKKLIEEMILLYAKANSYFIPPDDSWWVKFIRDSKIPALKEAVKKDTGLLMRLRNCFF